MYLHLKFGLYLNEKYLQIQSNTHKYYQQKVKPSTAVSRAKNKILPTMIHLNYNGNTGHVFESDLNQIKNMAM